jgi:hypothetical protein
VYERLVGVIYFVCPLFLKYSPEFQVVINIMVVGAGSFLSDRDKTITNNIDPFFAIFIPKYSFFNMYFCEKI